MVDDILNAQSGLLGISGVCSDMREIEIAIKQGNERAKLAFDIFRHRLAENPRRGVRQKLEILHARKGGETLRTLERWILQLLCEGLSGGFRVSRGGAGPCLRRSGVSVPHKRTAARLFQILGPRMRALSLCPVMCITASPLTLKKLA
jgi:hypothetical protein